MKKNNRGYTLMELMITCVIVAIVGAGAVKLISTVFFDEKGQHGEEGPIY